MLIILILFLGSLLFFARIYRTALTWFIRGRINQEWEKLAELITIAASLPFGIVYGFSSLEIILLLARLLMKTTLNLPNLILLAKTVSVQKTWLTLIFAVIFLLWMVPQTIAGSKVYAYDIEEKIRARELEKEME